MARRNGFVGFGAGLLAGVVATMALTGGHAVPRARAQAAPRAEPAETAPAQPAPVAQRYWVSVWAYPASYSGDGYRSDASHGAYLLDTVTGQLWSTEGQAGLRKVGPYGAR